MVTSSIPTSAGSTEAVRTVTWQEAVFPPRVAVIVQVPFHMWETIVTVFCSTFPWM